MKTSLYVALIALTTSISAHAIPPIPPSPIMSAPTVVKCEQINEVSEEQLQEFEEDRSLIISLDEASEELCYKIN